MYAATTDKTRHIAKSIGLHTVSYPKRRPHTNTNAVITMQHVYFETDVAQEDKGSLA